MVGAAAKNCDTRMEQAIRVMIVEDGIQARTALRALLSTWPEVEIVSEVANGQEAIDAVATTRPDVVLMDIQMPVMDGLEATRQIKQRWPEVGVIIVTMYSAYRAKALAAGADQFFNKAALPEEWLPWLRDAATARTP